MGRGGGLAQQMKAAGASRSKAASTGARPATVKAKKSKPVKKTGPRPSRSQTKASDLPNWTGLSLRALTEQVGKMKQGQRARVGGVVLVLGESRGKPRWTINLPGGKRISSVHAGQIAQQAIGANQPQKAGELSMVDQGKVDLAQASLQEHSDEALDRLAAGFSAKPKPTRAEKLFGHALAREMNDRRTKKLWQSLDDERAEQKRRWEQALEDTKTPAKAQLSDLRETFADCLPGVSEQAGMERRSLHNWHRFPSGENTATTAAIDSIGTYNGFSPQKVKTALSEVSAELDGLVVGREGSPVLYALLPAKASAKERGEIGKKFLSAMKGARADELSWPTPEGGHSWDIDKPTKGARWVRAWWD